MGSASGSEELRLRGGLPHRRGEVPGAGRAVAAAPDLRQRPALWLRAHVVRGTAGGLHGPGPQRG